MKKEINIPRPNETEVNKYLFKWDSLENYVLQEKSLNKLFSGDFKLNNSIENILIKCSTLNDFYSTNIFSIFSVAKHIFSIKDLDKRLNDGDLSLVNEIAKVTINNKEKTFYSFASKYCSHHNPICFPIFDDYVKKIIVYFNKKDKFSNIKVEELKEYKKFEKILNDFKKYYKLNEYNLKDIDRYLWQLGKEYFPKKY